MKTTREFTWTLSDGRTAKLIGTYVSELVPKTIDADGYIIDMGMKVSHYGSELVLYVNGKKVDSSSSNDFWRLIDIANGVKKIWGLCVGFTDESTADAYNAFLSELMQEDEVVAKVIAEKKQKFVEEMIELKIESCKSIIKDAKAGRIVSTREEAIERARSYNNLVNEGGSGYVPRWVTRDEYAAALAYINEHE